MEKSRTYQALKDWLERPSFVELGEYAMQTLPPDRAQEIARYLADHPEVQNELTTLQEELEAFESTLPPPAIESSSQFNLFDQVRDLIGQIKLPDRSLVTSFARGEADNDEPLVYEADGIEITVDIEPDDEGSYTLIGSVSEMKYHNMKVYLYRNDQLIATHDIDEWGDFYVPNLSPETYVIILEVPAFTFCIPELRIGK